MKSRCLCSIPARGKDTGHLKPVICRTETWLGGGQAGPIAQSQSFPSSLTTPHLLLLPGPLHRCTPDQNVPPPNLPLVNSSHPSSLSPTKIRHMSAEAMVTVAILHLFWIHGLPRPGVIGCKLHRTGILSAFLPSESSKHSAWHRWQALAG